MARSPYRITLNFDRRGESTIRAGEYWQPDIWHMVTGGGMPGILWLRMARDDSGAYVITAAQLDGNGAEITATAWRSVRLGAIRDELLRRPIPADDRGGAIDADGLREHYDPPDELDDEAARAAYLPNAPKPRRLTRQRGPGAAAPTDDDLARFAKAYDYAKRTDPRRAMKVTAERMNISRATAHRWKQRLEGQDT